LGLSLPNEYRESQYKQCWPARPRNIKLANLRKPWMRCKKMSEHFIGPLPFPNTTPNALRGPVGCRKNALRFWWHSKEVATVFQSSVKKAVGREKNGNLLHIPLPSNTCEQECLKPKSRQTTVRRLQMTWTSLTYRIMAP